MLINHLGLQRGNEKSWQKRVDAQDKERINTRSWDRNEEIEKVFSERGRSSTFLKRLHLSKSLNSSAVLLM